MPTKPRFKPFLYLIELLIIIPFWLLSGSPAIAAPAFVNLTDNRQDYPSGHIPTYSKFEIKFNLTDTAFTNPYFPFDPSPPQGITPGQGITVSAYFLPPEQSDWSQAKTLPCFYYQPMEELGTGNALSFVPLGSPDWRCRFAPDKTGTWSYRLSGQDAGGTAQSQIQTFSTADSNSKGFIKVSQNDPRFFEYSDGTPFLTPLINVEQGSPFNTLSGIRQNVQKLGQTKTNFVRWFVNGEGANFFVAPWGDNIRINWTFGASQITHTDVDTLKGKKFSFRPYYYSSQSIPLKSGSKYRLKIRAKVEGEKVLRLEIGNLKRLDICSSTNTGHQASGQTCDYKLSGWQDYQVEATATSNTSVSVGLRGLYVSIDAPSPFNQVRDGSIWTHSAEFNRDETGNNQWGGNHLTRSDPDTYKYIDQPSAARLDEIFKQSELYHVYHKLTVFHKNDEVINRFQADGTIGNWYQCSWGYCPNHFYAAEGRAARWLENAYTRYFVARWSYSTSLHSVEIGNENDLSNEAYEASFAFAKHFKDLNPHPTLMSNSFWGYWIESFWNHPTLGYLMDYSDKHWYSNTNSNNWELISTTWADSAQYVNECTRRFDQYRTSFNYHKPIVRGEGGSVISGTGPQHPDIETDPDGTYYHKKVWAHLGTLGDTCDGDWYPSIFLSCQTTTCKFPNEQRNLGQIFSTFAAFMDGEYINNGRYHKIGTDRELQEKITLSQATGAPLRAWGVKDSATHHTLLWIDNSTHTWANVVQNPQAISPGNAQLSIQGYAPNTTYPLEWWDPQTGTISSISSVISNQVGEINLPVTELTTDTAVKIGFASPTPHPGTLADLDHDLDVDFADYSLLLKDFGSLFSIFDFNRVISWFGRLFL